MTTPIVNDTSPRIQLVALQDSTIFIYNFVIFVDSDLAVFKTPVGQPPSSADLLQLTVDYNVDGVGDSNGGNVILVSPANAGDIITIERASPIQRITNFNPGDFTVEEMNDALNSQTTFSQDNEMIAEKLTPSYEDSAIVAPGQVKLPQLGDGEFWIGAPLGDGIVKAQLDQAPDCADLRTDLAVEAEFVDGARLVGFFDSTPAGVGPTTVHDALLKVTEAVIIPVNEQISANNNIVLGGDFSTNPFQEGISFSDIDIGVERYIADGWGIQITGTMRAATTKDLNDPVPVSLSNVFSDASLKITNQVPQAVLLTADRGALVQPIEGYYFREIAQRPFFLSFYTRSSVTGTYCIAFVSNGNDTSFVAEYTIPVANVWKRQIIEVPASPFLGIWGDYKTDRGVTLIFTLAAGTNSQQVAGTWLPDGNKIATSNQVNFFDSALGSTFNINLIQVEPTKNTTFDIRSQQQEIAFAQRYFEKSYNIDVAPGTVTEEGVIFNFVDQFEFNIVHPLFQQSFRTDKRIIPQMTWFADTSSTPDRVRGDIEGLFVVASTERVGTASTGILSTSTIVAIPQSLFGHYRADARMAL